jgi:hypothetical protein
MMNTVFKYFRRLQRFELSVARRGFARRWRFSGLAAASALILAVHPTLTQGAKLRLPISVPGWTGGGYLADHSNSFERCSATRSGGSASLSFSVDRDDRWTVSLSNPGWSFSKGARQSAFLKVADTAPLRATAFAADKDTLEIQVEDPMLLFSRMRVANQLRAIIGGLSIDVSLEGGEEVLSALTQCALRLSRRLQNGKSRYALFESGNSRTAEQEEAKKVVSDILSYSRAPKSSISPPAELAKLPVDVTWKAGLATAGLFVMGAAVPVSNVTDEIVARALRACGGGYFYLTRPDVFNGLSFQRVLSSCQTTDGTTLSYHLIVRRPKSGYYVFTVAASGSSFIKAPFKAADEYEAGLRSVLPLVIQNP